MANGGKIPVSVEEFRLGLTGRAEMRAEKLAMSTSMTTPVVDDLVGPLCCLGDRV